MFQLGTVAALAPPDDSKVWVAVGSPLDRDYVRQRLNIYDKLGVIMDRTPENCYHAHDGTTYYSATKQEATLVTQFLASAENQQLLRLPAPPSHVPEAITRTMVLH
jgi:hypothetical protein